MENVFEEQQEGITKNKYFMYNVSCDVQFLSSGGIKDLAANTLDDKDFKGKEMIVLSGYQRFV